MSQAEEKFLQKYFYSGQIEVLILTILDVG